MEILVEHGKLFGGLALLLLFLVPVGTAFLPGSVFSTSKRLWTTAFFGSVLVCLVVFRAPALMCPVEINVDESQTIAHTIQMARDPAPWRSADAVTSGPLNTYVYMWPYAFGEVPGYFALRFTSLVFIWMTIVAAWSVAVGLFGERLAHLFATPCTLYFSFAHENDFVHASTEYFPAALIAVAVALLCRGVRVDSMGGSCFAAGLLLGAAPMAKLQAAASAGMLGLIALVYVVLFTNKRVRNSSALVGGALTVPVILIVWSAMAGSLTDFWVRFVGQIWRYGAPNSFSYTAQFGRLCDLSPHFSTYLLWSLSVSIVGVILVVMRYRGGRMVGFVVFALFLWLSACAYSTVRTGYLFPHYLTFLAFPLTVLSLFASKALAQYSPKGVLVVVASAAALFIPAWIGNATASDGNHAIVSGDDMGDSISRLISSELEPDGSLAVWGWTPRYFAEGKVLSATKDVNCQYLIIEHSEREYYRSAYLAAIERAKPKLFIDSATDIMEFPGFPPVEERRFTNDPKIAAFIRKHYHLVASVTPRARQHPVWVFRLNPD